MYAFMYYGENPNCNHNILLKLLNMNCKPEQVNCGGSTALMYAFEYYGQNPNCDSRIFLKILDMNCVPERVHIYSKNTALICMRKYYISNPNYDPQVFVKLKILLNPSITLSELKESIYMYADDLQNNIMKAYLYNRRRTIINSRVSKRVSTGKYNSRSIFG